MATAVFLLEATCLLSAGAQWTGAWTQRIYGTGTADVWEVFGTNRGLSEVSWRQGWQVLQPLNEASFSRESFRQYVNQTLEERSPRLLVMECPTKCWRECNRESGLHRNSERQRRKRTRTVLQSFLEFSKECAEAEMERDRDFLLEVPANKIAMNNSDIIKLMEDESRYGYW